MSEDDTISADKMMIKAKGPVWHKKQKDQGIIPQKLRGLDQDATWSFSMADHWVYGHGTFSMVTHKIPVLGKFVWMTNSAHEGKKLYRDIRRFHKQINYACMDSKADDQKMYFNLQKHYKIQLLTASRKGTGKTPSRRKMMREMKIKQHKKIYKKRSTTVEPMQGLVAEIFELNRCWMRGNKNNRWIFAAMGVAIQEAQLQAFKENRSTWRIKSDVLGL